ncbi:MAG: SMI1/KNR4 family protein [Bacteroidetes bacterium]|nr:SMI1/KNR4 family protein [Bacteroidota bacterium]
MIKENLQFRIELVNNPRSPESDKFARDFVHSLGLKTHSGTWSNIELDSPRIDDFISESKNLIKNNYARFNGFCGLAQYIIEDEQTNSEWYELSPGKSMSIAEYGEIITCKADRMPPGIHIASGWSYNVYVSEKFKDAVQANQLTGLDFIWLKDTGRFKSLQWFLPVILNPLGRGIDHPWFDRKTLKGSGSNQPLNSQFRCGVNHFSSGQIKTNIVLDDKRREIIDLFDKEHFFIVSYKTYLKKFLPSCDFAFIWHQEDEKRKSDGFIHKQRSLCVNKKAKDILLKTKLISESELYPIRIIEDAGDAEILDGKGDLPTPFFTYSNITLEGLKKKLDVEWEKYTRKVRPEKILKLKDVLKLLVKDKKNRPEDFHKRLSEKELMASKAELPGGWIEILKKTNGVCLNAECTLVPYSEINKFSEEKKTDSDNVWEDYPENYPRNLIHVAYSINGDWYSLTLNTDSQIDSKVLRISHEECQPIEEWGTIAEFLFDMLTGDYD